ncbi:hypothetical protein GETHLI_28740 [Geothrix limicola]|uniref:Uncharacterized protein n=1 Tax=Geothrix limicola TaxID=2927978 RepID=A0ABQ5QIG6_9BACT|nr:hypothetical protein [Geothrix limicola]GLH74372.1 hypothetical protein GETHLI_28740 [Geothrix limicola]
MDLPENLHQLVSELGDSLLKALAEDDHCRDLAFQIQAKGYGLMLILEASPMSLGPREFPESEEGDASLPFSEDDLRLMKSFKIKMD